MKDYIDAVYQTYSKFTPVQEPQIIIKKKKIYSCDGVVKKGKDIQENFYELDDETGNIYQEKPNWIGGHTEPLSQAMANYIFEDVNVPINNDED